MEVDADVRVASVVVALLDTDYAGELEAAGDAGFFNDLASGGGIQAFARLRTTARPMGFEALRYQENYREEWKLGEVTLDIDTWPDLSTYVEIEGPGEGAVRATAEALGFDFAQASYGSVDEVYLAVLHRDILTEDTLTFATSPEQV